MKASSSAGAGRRRARLDGRHVETAALLKPLGGLVKRCDWPFNVLAIAQTVAAHAEKAERNREAAEADATGREGAWCFSQSDASPGYYKTPQGCAVALPPSDSGRKAAAELGAKVIQAKDPCKPRRIGKPQPRAISCAVALVFVLSTVLTLCLLLLKRGLGGARPDAWPEDLHLQSMASLDGLALHTASDGAARPALGLRPPRPCSWLDLGVAASSLTLLLWAPSAHVRRAWGGLPNGMWLVAVLVALPVGSGTQLSCAARSCTASLTYEQAMALNCTAVGGDLLVVGTQLASLETLRSLRSVNGSFVVAYNSALSSLYCNRHCRPHHHYRARHHQTCRLSSHRLRRLRRLPCRPRCPRRPGHHPRRRHRGATGCLLPAAPRPRRPKRTA